MAIKHCYILVLSLYLVMCSKLRIELNIALCNLVQDLAQHWNSKSILVMAGSDRNGDLKLAKFLINCVSGLHFFGKLNTNRQPSPSLDSQVIIIIRDERLVQEALQQAAFWRFKYLLLDINYPLSTFIPQSCELLLVTKTTSNEFLLKEIWQIAKDTPVIVDDWGSWSSISGLKKPYKALYDRRKVLRGYNFRLVYQTSAPVRGPNVRENVFEMLQTQFNFTITYKVVNRTASVKLPNGTVSGLHKILRDGEAEVTAVVYGINSERLNIMSFLWIGAVSTSNLYISETAEFDQYWYTKPFSEDLWRGFSLWAFISIILITIILSIGQKITFMRSLSEAILQILASISSQWTILSLQYKKMLLLVFVPYLGTLILNPAFSGAIVSLLTVPITKLPFLNVEGFVDNGQYDLITKANGYYHQYILFDNATIPRLIREKQLLTDNLPLTSIESFQKLCTNPYLVHLDDDTTSLTEPLSCRIRKIPGVLFRLPVGFLIQDNFPFYTSMTLTIRQLQQSGIKGYYKNRWIVGETELQFTSIGMEAVSSLLKVLSGIYFLSIFFLCIEITVHKFYLNN